MKAVIITLTLVRYLRHQTFKDKHLSHDVCQGKPIRRDVQDKYLISTEGT